MHFLVRRTPFLVLEGGLYLVFSIQCSKYARQARSEFVMRALSNQSEALEAMETARKDIKENCMKRVNKVGFVGR